MTARAVRRRRTHGALAVAVSVLVLTGCGLPDSGSRQVDAADVPYGLLEAGSPSTPSAGTRVDPDARVPIAFWVDGDEQLGPAPSGVTCSLPVRDQVELLLDLLSDGPTDDVRAAGRTSAWAPDTRLVLASLEGTTAVVAVDAGARTTADRLPLAIGQVVLTLTTARRVTSVSFADPAGAPLPVPLPGGVLTEDPVTAADYASLGSDASGGSSDSAQGIDVWRGCR